MAVHPSRVRYDLLSVAGLFLFLASEVYAGAKFEGKLVIEFKQAGERLELLENYYFIDKNYKMWTARKGLITDGASIPRWAWTSIGSPLGAPYVNAAVIHDQYCVLRTEKPEDVHRMFYEAMIVAGVSKLKAKLMYAAVYYAGPWWDWRTIENARNAFRATFMDPSWNRPDYPDAQHPHKFPPKDMFKKRPDGKPLICEQGCDWTELNDIEKDWISKRVPVIERKETAPQEQMSIAEFIDTDPAIDEIDRFLNILRKGIK